MFASTNINICSKFGCYVLTLTKNIDILSLHLHGMHLLQFARYVKVNTYFLSISWEIFEADYQLTTVFSLTMLKLAYDICK